MTPEERAQLSYLCEMIATEKNGEKFDSLVDELMALIERKHKRIHPEHQHSRN
jgi:hypothetical protein